METDAMSDHEWVQEHIATGVTGGLSESEMERLETHIDECTECAKAWNAARKLDRTIGSLFASVRPDPLLEDRTIHSLRGTSSRRFAFSGWQRKLTAGIAATFVLGATGAVMSHLADGNELPFPGAPVIAQSRTPASASASRITREAQVVLDDSSSIAREFAERARSETQPRGQNYIFPTHEGYVGGQNIEANQEGRVKIRGFADIDGAVAGDLTADATKPARVRAAESPPAVATAPPANYGSFQSQLDGPVFYGGYAKPSDLKPAMPTPPQSRAALYINHSAEQDVAAQHKATLGDFVRKVDDPRGDVLVFGPKAGQQPNAPPTPPAVTQEPQSPRKIIIRSGDIEFEVESFDSAVATVTKLVTEIKGAFVATVNSDKLPNGKVKGSMVVRVPPEHLDSLVLDLRRELGKGGELKRQKIGSQDITKQYTDLESRLKAARTMEQRLLQIIKDGKGEIKQLLEAEKELGVWRTKIEELEGELRYYGNLVSLSTLTITMAEKEIRSAAQLTESERIQAGVEVEDVDHTRQQMLTVIADVKGRVIKSELKQLAAGQFNATMQFEVTPDAAGPIRDRLCQLGRVARLEIDRVQQAEGGTVPKDAKVVRGDTQFLVQFYNLANVAPRETATLQLAVVDVVVGYQALRDAIEKVHGRVLTAKLDEQDRQNIVGHLDFEVRRADEGAMQTAIAAAGDVIARNVIRAPEGDNLTDSKVLFRTTLVNAARLKPRELVTLAIDVTDVDKAATVLGALVAESKGRVVDAQVAHEQAGRVTARIIYDVPLAAAPALVEKFASTGTVRLQQSSKDPQAPDGRFATARVSVTLSNTDLIVAKDVGLWTQIRKGLSYSVSVLLLSVTWVVFGLCVVLPWAIIGYVAYRVFRRLFRPAPAVSSTASLP